MLAILSEILIIPNPYDCRWITRPVRLFHRKPVQSGGKMAPPKQSELLKKLRMVRITSETSLVK